MINVILVDDEELVLDLLQTLLHQYTDLHVAATFTRPSDVLASVGEMKPQAAFLDIEMPGMNGLELADKLQELVPGIEIVMVTAFSDYAVQAFHVNAIDYVLKPPRPEELIRCAEKLKKRLIPSSRPPEPPERPERVQITGFGGFEASTSSSGLIRFPTSKVEELFAYLLVHRNGGCAKWEICEQLWPGFEPERAEQNFHTSVYRLRKLIKEHRMPLKLSMHLGSYRLTGEFDCDFIVFEEEAFGGEGESAMLEHAVRSYKGPLFDGKSYLWCEPLRHRLERRFAKLIKELAAECEEEGNLSRAAEWLQMLLDQTLDEEGYELLLRLCAKQGNKSSFLHHYQTLERRLADELGLTPGPALQRLYDEMVT